MYETSEALTFQTKGFHSVISNPQRWTKIRSLRRYIFIFNLLIFEVLRRMYIMMNGHNVKIQVGLEYNLSSY